VVSVIEPDEEMVYELLVFGFVTTQGLVCVPAPVTVKELAAKMGSACSAAWTWLAVLLPARGLVVSTFDPSTP
jgi:hypothetical protein